jgi:hypothetical protein
MAITVRRRERNPGWTRLLLAGCAVAILPITGSPAADPLAPLAPRIKTAIERGASYLAVTQSPDGTWNSSGHELGETALAGMAILAAGGDVHRAKVEAAAAAVRRLAPGNARTYEVSLAIMFLDRLGSPEDARLLRELGIRLMAGQCADGSWSYGVPAAAQGEASGRSGCATGDNSNTQFAALAAWISRRHGLQNDAALQRLDEHFRTTFDSNNGGWGYGGQSSATPTMTCAGLVGLATHLGAEKQRQRGDPSRGGPYGKPSAGRQGRGAAAAADPVAKAALAALGNALRIASADPGSTLNQDLYFYWSLERVGVIYGVRHMGGIDWYDWGSARLVNGQRDNGEWSGLSSSKGWRFEANVGTSFAILFLCKANVAADLTAQVGQGGGAGSGGGVLEDPAPPGLGGGTQFLRRAGRDDPPPGVGAGAKPGNPRTTSPGSTAPGKPAPAGKTPGNKPASEPDAKPRSGPGLLDPF